MELIITDKISSLVFHQYAYLDRGIHGHFNFISQKGIDYDNDGNEEIVIDNSIAILFYEYNGKNGFDLIDSIPLDTNYLYIGIQGIGDLDGDGLKDVVLWKTDSKRLWVYEQSSPTSFFDSLVWTSDTIHNSCYYIGITNKLKHDGVNRIFGIGIPWLTTQSRAYGWYYYTCTGDNRYELLNTFAESTRSGYAIDIGDIDEDGLTDVIIGLSNYIYRYESTTIDDDTFIRYLETLSEGAGPAEALLILPDIDRDGTNEIMKYQINYLTWSGYVSYGYFIYEDKNGTGVYDLIWRRDFEVATDYIYTSSGDIDYGDTDGDGLNEFVICGGRHIEVWESIGDNQFEMMWEWTDPTTYTIQSHLRCNDFNKNGIDELIFSGVGQTGQCTRIFEMKRWSMEGDTLLIGNSDDGDTIYKVLVIRNESDAEISIDSITINSAYFGVDTIIWPLTIKGNDSTSVKVWFKGDSMGRYFDSMNVYVDKTSYKEYLKAGNKLELIVDSIKAYDGVNPISGIDNDDIIVFYFNWWTNKPDINKSNIDSILRLSGGDEWEVNGWGIELTKWLSYPDGDRFYVYFDTNGKIPTIKVGDTVYTDSQTITGTWCQEKWKKQIIITGSFGPNGFRERDKISDIDKEEKIKIEGQDIIWNTNTRGELVVYDLTGRKIIREETDISGEYKTDLRKLSNGVYFIKLKTENQTLTEKMIKIR
ncbi:MAG: T9SS type A sorting domain-containing protein [candidate division WOR-3 bacterium]